MNKLFIYVLTSILFVSLSGCTSPAQRALEEKEIQAIVSQAQNAKVLLVDVYQDRCPTCQLVEPAFQKLKEKYSRDKDIAFLKYDFSSPFTILKSWKIAKPLGLEKIFKAQRYTGIVLFVDMNTKQIFATLVGEYNIEKYVEIIEKKSHGNAKA